MPSEKTTPESESRSSREGREVSEVRERRQAPAQLDRASQREGCRLPARPDRTPHDEAPPACLSGDPTCAPTERILEPEVRRHHRRKRKLLEFTHSSTRATMLMLAAAVAALNRAAGHVRSEVAKRMHIRKTPEFRFVADGGAAYAQHINELIEGL